MHNISSSFFGRLFGNATHLSLNHDGLTVTVKGVSSALIWQDLISPPVFTLHWLGQTVTFSTADKHYVLSKLAYQSDKKQKVLAEQYWIAAHAQRLERLLTKIDTFVHGRYLRQSGVKRIQVAVQAEYARWFPWATVSQALGESAELVQLLANYQQWQTHDINDFRESYIDKQLSLHQHFFDNVESNPLTLKQRRACIIDDDNNLLLAGAGTGKTSVMVGRAGYLINSQQASHHELLLLAYGKKAADEMDGRIKEKLNTHKISATTFHQLGLTIIAQVEGEKPNISVFAEDEKAKAKWVQGCFEQFINDQASYRHLVLDYFSRYYYAEKNAVDFESLGDYYQYLTDNDIRSLKGEKVKSFGELRIANWIFQQGIEYRYEQNYAIAVNTMARKQYQPDFFLPALNVYIEYFGIDEHGDTASYIDKDEYHASMLWKEQTHKDNNTQCIKLTYAHHKRGALLKTLDKQLSIQQKAYNAPPYEALPDEVLLATLKETGRITLLAEIFAKLLGLYKSACVDDVSEQVIIEQAADPKQMYKAFELLSPIYDAYQKRLAENNEIDFEDMISKALEYINTGKFCCPWRFIMVDEFQDISEPRARLVKALRDNNKGCSVFAVGDDWQAIYRFSGADVTLTTSFTDYFGDTAQTTLDTTFRFNNRIGDVATAFVSKNPAQISKTIRSIHSVEKPAVSLLRKTVSNTASQGQQVIDEIANGALHDVLKAISQQVNKPVSVYLLARFWFQLPNAATLQTLKNHYPTLNIQTQSFHASKGKEADYVVMLGLTSGKHGFPSVKATPAILEALLAKQEPFEHAEERRLFYVALTRAKHRVYIIADMGQASVFVKELIDEHDVELNEFGITVNQAFVDQINCLVCETGSLKPRVGHYGPFYGCSHFPRCDHKERACVKCESVMSKNKYPGFKVCLNESCNELLPICKLCGAEMALRKSAKGSFWGCRNYKGNEPQSCKNGIDHSKIQWPKINS